MRASVMVHLKVGLAIRPRKDMFMYRRVCVIYGGSASLSSRTILIVRGLECPRIDRRHSWLSIYDKLNAHKRVSKPVRQWTASQMAPKRNAKQSTSRGFVIIFGERVTAVAPSPPRRRDGLAPMPDPVPNTALVPIDIGT
jgi:hypothetical protein